MRSIAKEIRNAKQGGRAQTPVTVSGQRPQNAAGMELPGEGGTVPAPRAKEDSTKPYADAVGGHFGGSR